MEFYELCGSYAAMGAAQGARFRRAGVQFSPRLDSLQLRHGTASAAVLREVFPEAWEELEAVSAAVGMAPGEMAAWLLCMGCCLYNLERNVPEYRGCTAFAFRRAERVLYGRNNDLPSYLGASAFSTPPPAAAASTWPPPPSSTARKG